MSEHGLARSIGKLKQDAARGVKADPLVLACQAKGLSLTGLAAAMKAKVGRNIAPSVISMARRGLRPISPDVAEAIQELTGFEASTKHWPGGIR